jgi:tetratricopeptide (TPR) repeat protein
MARVVHSTKWLYGCAAALSLGAASAQSSELAARVDNAVAQIRSSRNAEEAREARQALESIIGGPTFAQLDRSQKDNALAWASMAAAGARDYAHAHQLALRLIELDGAAPKNWLFRFDYALRAGYIEDALVSLTRVVEQWPQEATRVPPSQVYQLVTAANRLPNSNAKLRLLSAMYELKARRRFAGEPSELWRELALVLLERGELSKARDVVARIAAPGTLVRARADRRFDPLLATNPELFDVAAAAALELNRLEAEVRSAPDFIEPILNFSTGLEASNRCDDALKLVEEAIARASGPTAEEQPFRDVSRNLTWLLDHRSRILRCLGRMEEALQREIRAARLTENGTSNTNQALNLAHLFLDMDRPKDAIEVLDAVGPMSGYGKMVEQWARLRVAVALDDDDGTQAALAYLSDHREDSLSHYQSALLKVGQVDAAAAVLIGRLEDLSTRVEVLETYQRYGAQADESEDDEPKGLLARADVRAAIERVGKIESYPYLRSSGWLGY